MSSKHSVPSAGDRNGADAIAPAADGVQDGEPSSDACTLLGCTTQSSDACRMWLRRASMRSTTPQFQRTRGKPSHARTACSSNPRGSSTWSATGAAFPAETRSLSALGCFDLRLAATEVRGVGEARRELVHGRRAGNDWRFDACGIICLPATPTRGQCAPYATKRSSSCSTVARREMVSSSASLPCCRRAAAPDRARRLRVGSERVGPVAAAPRFFVVVDVFIPVLVLPPASAASCSEGRAAADACGTRSDFEAAGGVVEPGPPRAAPGHGLKLDPSASFPG
eukprot:scaffold264147_cov30-Tisochrysis_lutea.AAC.7